MFLSVFFVSCLGLSIQLLWVNAVDVFGKVKNSGRMNVNMSFRFITSKDQDLERCYAFWVASHGQSWAKYTSYQLCEELL